MPKSKRLMEPQANAPDAVRRQLITRGALTAAVSASVSGSVASRPAWAEAPEGRAPTDARNPSYQVTDHIAAYYRRARE